MRIAVKRKERVGTVELGASHKVNEMEWLFITEC